MDWEIKFSRQADKFLKNHRLSDTFVTDLIRNAIRRLRGEIVAVNLKRLGGKWAGCYRVRLGKNRVIFSINFEAHRALVEVIDDRGKVYK